VICFIDCCVSRTGAHARLPPTAEVMVGKEATAVPLMVLSVTCTVILGGKLVAHTRFCSHTRTARRSDTSGEGTLQDLRLSLSLILSLDNRTCLMYIYHKEPCVGCTQYK